MRRLASAEGISILAPEDAYFSYYNSPYIGHNTGTAVDIYPRHQQWGGPVYSPCAGKVTAIRRIKMGRKREFPSEDIDYGISIAVHGIDDPVIRVLHCRPTVSIGDTVTCGDQIGEAIRSRYFNYWTGPHYHVEILHQQDFLRSSRSLQIDVPEINFSKHKQKEVEDLHMTIQSVTKDAMVVTIENIPQVTSGDLYGIGVSVENEIFGLLDSGLPHYKVGGILSTKEKKLGSSVEFVDKKIATLSTTRGGVYQFRTEQDISFQVDHQKIRGLSSYIFPENWLIDKNVPVIIVPNEYGQFHNKFQVGDIVNLKLIKS